MAVFLVNVCKFNSCGLKFSSLQDLIRHIEEIHLEHDQKSVDNVGNAICLPVSCVLRIFSSRDESLSSFDVNSNTLNESHVRKSINSPAVSLSTTPTDGSEIDGDDADSDSGQSSIDSWATANMDSNTNPLLKFHQIMGSNVSGQSLDENNNSTKLLNGVNKEYICGISGCTKRYRSSNSLSHHRRSACHTSKPFGSTVITAKPLIDESNKKLFNCPHCSKTYKTSHGLKNHNNIHHTNNNNQMNRAQVLNGNSNLAIASNALEIKQEMPAQVSSFVQITSTKNEFSPMKETINAIPKAKNANSSVLNGDFLKIKNGTFHSFSEIISGNNCPPVSSNVEVISEPKSTSKCPIISAPTLQQHLLSPIIPKVASN